MARYIDADAFEAFGYTRPTGKYDFDDGVEFVLNKIDEQPTADVVEVVRCKDCKHNQNSCTSGNADCELFYGMTDQEGFCSFGDRRENGI